MVQYIFIRLCLVKKNISKIKRFNIKEKFFTKDILVFILFSCCLPLFLSSSFPLTLGVFCSFPFIPPRRYITWLCGMPIMYSYCIHIVVVYNVINERRISFSIKKMESMHQIEMVDFYSTSFYARMCALKRNFSI